MIRTTTRRLGGPGRSAAMITLAAIMLPACQGDTDWINYAIVNGCSGPVLVGGPAASEPADWKLVEPGASIPDVAPVGNPTSSLLIAAADGTGKAPATVPATSNKISHTFDPTTVDHDLEVEAVWELAGDDCPT